jgi:predicted ABC-type ATPase
MKKFLLLLDGMMGSGKTTTSRVLRGKLPRTAIIGMDTVKRYISDFERGTRDNLIARKVVAEMTKKFLDLDISVIIEQPIKDEEVLIYEGIANSFSVPCYKFQLFTTPETAFNRVMERQIDSKNKNPEERVRNNISLFKNKSDLGFELIDTSNLKSEEPARIILDRVNKD